MNKRIISIIYELCRPQAEITISRLAEKYKVSPRTVRNDLNAISSLLEENRLNGLHLKSGGVVCREDDFEKILPFLSDRDFYTYKLSKEERVRVSAALLVNSQGYMTISAVADSLFVSRATVINDLDDIKKYIKAGSLSVFSHPNKGLRVDGLESDKRMFLMKQADRRDMAPGQVSVQAGNRIVIQKILNEQEHVHASFFTDGSFQEILLYLGIMVDRNIQGEFLEAREKNSNGRYRMAQDILRHIVQYCHINTTEDEVQFLSEMLAAARYIKNKPVQKNVVKIQMITRVFIEKVSGELGIRLDDDYEFFENLSNHLASILSEKTFYPENPVIDEILEENRGVLEAVEKKGPVIQSCVGRDLKRKDLEYIAVHVCAALERRKNREVAFHVIVACHAGIGTSRLLLERLKTHFHFHIVDVVSSHEARNLEAGTADLVITTVPLEGCRMDYVVVSPLLNDEDYIRVGNKIDALRSSRNFPMREGEGAVTAKGVMERIEPLIFEEVPEAAPDLVKKLRKTVRDYFSQSLEADTDLFAPYLHHLLPPSHITLDVVCSGWREAVEKAGERLLKRGYIEQRYITAMIQNIEENGPYVVISPGFAVPHEGLEAGSIKVGMHLIRLKAPVSFGAEEFDPVEFVCVLSAVDHKIHLKAFFHLVNMLQTKDFKQKLHESRTPEEAAKVIEEFEYEVMA